MTRTTGKTNPATGVRRGTATSKSGKATAAKLVAAAHDLLETESFERFSMRNVAERAGVNLANLQYYFPRKEDLAHAMYLDVGARYQAAYAESLANAPADPHQRFKLLLHWNMQDIGKKATRQFFIQFWALLGSLDDFNGRYLKLTYDIDIAQLSKHIEDIQPGISKEKIRQRATLIAAMIEGLMVVTGDVGDKNQKHKELYDAAIVAMMAIALGK